jgi:UDPglucose 6-dehydrogenase
LASGRLQFALGAAATATCDLVFVCVATPRGPDDAPDLQFVQACIAEVAPLLAPSAIVITKSTVPVGTTDNVRDWIGRPDIDVVANPEFLREGSAVHDFMHPDRIVVGADNPTAADRVLALYERCGAPAVRTDPRTAEMLKYAANAYLATRLSFINAIAGLCDAMGTDIDGIIDGLGRDGRIGHHFLQPGPGWGGSCLPKDTRALVRMAADAGFSFQLLEKVIAANEQQIGAVVGKIRAAVGGSLNGASVGVLGLSFKANTDDLRDSPAVTIVEQLLAEGARVSAYDPSLTVDLANVEVAATPYAAAEGADVIAVLTEWDEFRDLDLEKLAAAMRTSAVVDARNMLDKSSFVQAGYAYTGLGR